MTTPKLFNETQRETLTAIVDTFVAPLTADEEDTLIQATLSIPNNDCFSKDQLRTFAKISASSIGVVDRIEKKLPVALSPKKISDFLMVLNLLSYRPSSILFTGTWTLFKDLDRADREKIIIGWRKSSLSVFSKQLYSAFMGLGIIESYMAMESPLYKSLVYPGVEGGHVYFQQQPDYKKVQHERLHMLSTEEATKHKRFDAIVIGSGAGGGVAAAELSKAGLSVLVIEKGKYFHQDEMPVDDDGYAATNMYENGGTSPNATGSVNFLAASTFGGGTTINYLACIPPQDFVRKQWEKQGLPYFVSQQFEQDIQIVNERIGVSHENIVQSGPNRKLIEGCIKLGHSYQLLAQNTSGRPHHCGKCYTGCSAGIKNSTTNTWLKDAAAHGAKFLDSTLVTRILIKNGKAIGVACKIHEQEKTHYFFADKIVVAGGALHTPSLLIKSGLKNPNIGNDLRLHLASIVIGIYDEIINPSEGSLLTVVGTAFENYDGSTYGFKVECYSNGVGFYSAMMPWEGAAKHKQWMMRHRNAVITFAMIRDKDSTCSVKYDPYGKLDVSFNLSKRDGDTLTEGIVQMAKIHIVAGARQIHVTQHNLDSFVFEKEEESSITNPRFLKWVDYVYKQGPPTPSSGHQMASCRMGRSPKTSACKETGETWDVRNLYVADSSLFPTALGVNPMVTIQAIALNVSRNIIQSIYKEDQQAKL